MSEYLKGNYKAPQPATKEGVSEQGENTGVQNEFEKRALEKLGGSIAFVMKSKTFLWTAPEENTEKKP